jgi:hypothetical protein
MSCTLWVNLLARGLKQPVWRTDMWPVVGTKTKSVTLMALEMIQRTEEEHKLKYIVSVGNRVCGYIKYCSFCPLCCFSYVHFVLICTVMVLQCFVILLRYTKLPADFGSEKNISYPAALHIWKLFHSAWYFINPLHCVIIYLSHTAWYFITAPHCVIFYNSATLHDIL